LAVGCDYGVTLLMASDRGGFQEPATYSVGNEPSAVALGDFNGDGILDMAVANATSNTISILLGNGDGTFTAAATLAAAGPGAVIVADFNGDGKLDLAVSNSGSLTISIYLG